MQRSSNDLWVGLFVLIGAAYAPLVLSADAHAPYLAVAGIAKAKASVSAVRLIQRTLWVRSGESWRTTSAEPSRCRTLVVTQREKGCEKRGCTHQQG
mgnify:CR=1 FL=1